MVGVVAKHVEIRRTWTDVHAKTYHEYVLLVKNAHHYTYGFAPVSIYIHIHIYIYIYIYILYATVCASS